MNTTPADSFPAHNTAEPSSTAGGGRVTQVRKLGSWTRDGLVFHPNGTMESSSRWGRMVPGQGAATGRETADVLVVAPVTGDEMG